MYGAWSVHVTRAESGKGSGRACIAQGLGMGLGGPSWSLPAFVDSLPTQPSLPLPLGSQPAVCHFAQLPCASKVNLHQDHRPIPLLLKPP